MSNTLRDKYAIVGVGESGRSKKSGVTTLELAIRAASAAIADAGIRADEIDFVANYGQMDSVDSHTLASHLGIRPASQYNLLGGGGSTELLVSQAIAAIDAGLVRTALIYRSTNGRSGKRLGGAMEGRPGGAFTEPYGLATPGERVAVIAARHMYETGLTEQHLYEVCKTFHDHAQHNPTAMLHGGTLDEEKYFSAPYICTPFRLFDYCLETDEANAIIITSAERARDLRKPPVYISGVVGRNSVPHAYPFAQPDITDVGANYAAPQVYAQAGLGPDDIQVAAIYDCFSWVVLKQLESYGFVKPGESGDFVADGGLTLAGRLPANTAGGMSAEGYTNGLNNAIELVRQVRRDYEGTERQAPNTEVGLVTGWNGPTTASAMILHR